jgi:hypothetical protein
MSATLQGDFYDEHQDYAAGSPHLKHRRLNGELLGLVFAAIESAAEAGLPPTVLEIGAGDGSITEPLLASGLTVTSTEMSAASVGSMQARFRRNDRFRAVLDPDGSLGVLGEERFGCVLFASVLHHIPDYETAIAGAIDAHLLPGGSLVSIQDPLWYPRMNAAVRHASSAAYLSWRIFQGDFARGLRTRLRRATSGLSEEAPGDAIEYHVVRDGVDEDSIAALLRPSFDRVEVHRYWSTQGAPQQRLGETAGVVNTFALRACGYRPEAANNRSACTQVPSSP